MKVTKREILECVVESIRDVMPDEKADAEIHKETDPIQHLGMDSFDGVAFACPISERLGLDLPGELNPFVDDKKHRSRCVREIVDFLYELLEQKMEQEGDDHE